MTTPAEPPGGDSASDAADGAASQDVPKPAGAPGPAAVAADPADADVPDDRPGAPQAGAPQAGVPGPAGARSEPVLVAGPGPAPRRPIRWLRVLAACTALLVLALAGGAWYFYQHLNGNITTDTATETQLRIHASERPTQGPTEAENILLIGSDNRGSGNEKYGEDSGTQRSDTTILLHLAADRSSATAVSIPRDLMAHVPDCTRPDGSTKPGRFEQFNWAFQDGGAACTIRTVEDMTGVRIDHHLIVDFTGFKKMVDAVDGVEVCVPEPVHDTKAHLDLPAGRQKLNGEQALGYVRARYSIGDGSDTQRMERQQDFLASLINKVRSNGVLLNPLKLYPLLQAATASLTADPGLDSLSELYSLVNSLQKTPSDEIRFLTLPREQYSADHNRDQLLQPDADRLFAALQADRAVSVTSGTPDPSATATGVPGTTGTPSAGPTAEPTYRGTTVDRDICGKDR